MRKPPVGVLTSFFECAYLSTIQEHQRANVPSVTSLLYAVISVGAAGRSLVVSSLADGATFTAF